MTLGVLRDPRLRVIEAMTLLTSETPDGRYLAEATELGEVGLGSTPARALYDLQRTIAELYWACLADPHRLGPGMAAIWAVLQRKVQEVPR